MYKSMALLNPRSLKASKTKAKNSPTTSIIPKLSAPCRRTARWRCCAARREGILDVVLRLDTEAEKPKWDAPHNPCEGRIAARFGIRNQGRPADKWLADTARWTWRVKSFMHLETELMGALRERSELDAINVFATNLKALLLAAPAGQRATMGLDPGLRTGVKVAVVDATGKVVDTAVIYPHQPKNDWDGSLHTLGRLAAKHNVSLISIGNGTASRETDKLAQDLIKQHPEQKNDQDRRLGGGRLRVLGVRVRLARTAGHGRVAARRRVDRAPAAGSAGRAGQDRPEIDRRRPVPARRVADPAEPARWTRWSRIA